MICECLVVLWEGGVAGGEGCRHHAQSHKRALPSDSSVGLKTWKRRETKIFTRSSHYQLTEGRGGKLTDSHLHMQTMALQVNSVKII